MLKQLGNKVASGDHRAIKLPMPLAETCLASSSWQRATLRPLRSAAKRRVRALETIKILNEVDYFDHVVDSTSEMQAGCAEASAETEAQRETEHNSEDRL